MSEELTGIRAACELSIRNDFFFRLLYDYVYRGFASVIMIPEQMIQKRARTRRNISAMLTGAKKRNSTIRIAEIGVPKKTP